MPVHFFLKQVELSDLDDSGLAVLGQYVPGACLDKLELHQCRVTDDGLRSLRGMDIFCLQLDSPNIHGEGLKYLAEIEGLRYLTLSLHAPSEIGFREVGRLTRLEFLVIYAGSEKIDSMCFRHLAPLKSLKLLQLVCKAITANEMAIIGENHPSLMTLQLGGIDDSVVTEIVKRLPHLEVLQIGESKVTDEGLAQLAELKKLWHLTIDGPNVTDDSLKHLEGLTNLQHLELTWTKVTPAGINSLKAVLPNCKVICSGKPAPNAVLPIDTTPPLAIAPLTPEEAKQHQKAWADYLGVPVEFENTLGMKMVLSPPGEFMMGSPDSDPDAENSEKPQHKVRITKPFYLAAHAVTVGQFKIFAEEASYKVEAETAGGKAWMNPGFRQTDAHPVVFVSWKDSVTFCEWLSKKCEKTYRLPTEAEWEFSCRSGSTARWHFGDDERDLDKYATPMMGKTVPVGQKLPNGFGLFDMHGNAAVWCSDWIVKDYYKSSPVEDPKGPPSGEWRVVRGAPRYGSKQKNSPATSRNAQPPTSRLGHVGFRPVMLIDPDNPPKLP